MAEKTQFTENNPDVPHLISGGLLNRFGVESNANLNSRGGTGGHGTRVGGIHMGIVPPEFVIGQAVIIDDDDTCPNPNPSVAIPNQSVGETPIDSETGRGAPCGFNDTYLCRFRWYNHVTETWETYGETLRLDAGGYFEGATVNDELIVDDAASHHAEAEDGDFLTEASRSPVDGPGFGPIPIYHVGEVVTAYWDSQRGYVVPVHSPPADIPRAVFVSDRVVIDRVGATNGEAVEAFLEIETETGTISILPADEKTFRLSLRRRWVPVGELHWQVPPMFDGFDWKDSRSAFAYFTAPNWKSASQTKIRLRIRTDASYEINVSRAVLDCFGAGRKSISNAYTDVDDIANEPDDDGAIIPGWANSVEVKGRYRDQPRFFSADDSGAQVEADWATCIGIDYLEPSQDEWFIGVHFSVTITPGEDSGGISTTSSKSESSASSDVLVSSQSSLSSSSGFDSSQSSQSTSSSSVITSQSSQSETLVSSEDGYGVHWTCVEVVTDVLCAEDGTVESVCKRIICFPIPPGLRESQAVSVERCAPCDNLSSASGSYSDSTSNSTSDSTSSADPCVGVELEPIILSAEDCVECCVNVVQGITPDAQQYWDDVLLDNDLSIELLVHDGNGTVTFNEDTGEVCYIPAEDGSDDGKTVTVSVRVCDGGFKDLSSASSTSEEKSESSVSSSSESSTSEEKSESSVSSSSSSIDLCAEVADCDACLPGTALTCPERYSFSVDGIKPHGSLLEPTAQLVYWLANGESREIFFDFTANSCSHTYDYGMGIIATLTITETSIDVYMTWGPYINAQWSIDCPLGIECDRRYNLGLVSSQGGGEIDWDGAKIANFNLGRSDAINPCDPLPPPPEQSSSSSSSYSSGSSMSSSSMSSGMG